MDKFGIGDSAYHELASAFSELPPKYQILQERSTRDSLFHIERCPGNVPGVFVSIANEISLIIRNNDAKNDKPLEIKVAGDGTRVSRISNLVTV